MFLEMYLAVWSGWHIIYDITYLGLNWTLLLYNLWGQKFVTFTITYPECYETEMFPILELFFLKCVTWEKITLNKWTCKDENIYIKQVFAMVFKIDFRER